MKEIIKSIDYDCPPRLPKALSGCRPLFLDIETTGLSPVNSHVYLIGYIFQDSYGNIVPENDASADPCKNSAADSRQDETVPEADASAYDKTNSGTNVRWRFIQWLAETPREEREILVRAAAFADRFDCLVHFNGDHFDLPYLHRRCEGYGIRDNFLTARSFDLYRELAGCKKFLGLENCRLKTIEKYLGIAREDLYDGGTLIEVYKEYARRHDSKKLKLLLLHNEEDVVGMPELLPLLAFAELMAGELYLEGAAPEAQLRDMSDFSRSGGSSDTFSTTRAGSVCIDIAFPLADSLPKEACASLLGYTVRASGDRLTLTLPVYTGELKYFFPNFRDYYYLPEEGIAVHKSVAAYVDKNHREQATARNCFTTKTGTFVPVPANSSGRLFRKRFGGPTYREVDEELLTDRDFWIQYLDSLFRLL